MHKFFGILVAPDANITCEKKDRTSYQKNYIYVHIIVRSQNDFSSIEWQKSFPGSDSKLWILFWLHIPIRLLRLSKLLLLRCLWWWRLRHDLRLTVIVNHRLGPRNVPVWNVRHPLRWYLGTLLVVIDMRGYISISNRIAQPSCS